MPERSPRTDSEALIFTDAVPLTDTSVHWVMKSDASQPTAPLHESVNSSPEPFSLIPEAPEAFISNALRQPVRFTEEAPDRSRSSRSPASSPSTFSAQAPDISTALRVGEPTVMTIFPSWIE